MDSSIAISRIEADIENKHADTFRSLLHPDFRTSGYKLMQLEKFAEAHGGKIGGVSIDERIAA